MSETKIVVCIPHSRPAYVLEINSPADMLTDDERNDLHAAYEFGSLGEAIAWAEAYRGHQHHAVRARLYELIPA